jgi:transketolase
MINSKMLALEIRRNAIEMTHRSNSPHIGSVLSIADIVAVLYAEILNLYPMDPKSDLRDRFILSKGHAGIAVYIALAKLGFFSEEKLKTYYNNGSNLSGHVSHKGVPGVEFSTGSLGHGMNVAVGMAMAGKIDKKRHKIFVIIGDGECDEGSIWEAALFANHYRLSNLTVIIDHNKIQSLDLCENTIELLSLSSKWKAFGWDIMEIDGHNHSQLGKALSIRESNKPLCIIANTIKGKGISFMENQVLWHYKSPQGDDYNNAIKELEELRE